MDTSRISDYRLNNDGSFDIFDYRSKPLFFSFLPGIAGKHGIPIWAFYTNRGQCICSFGIENKQRSIMEYFPANQAAARVELQGFRTFLRVDGAFYEPFASGSPDKVRLRIHLNQLELLSLNEKLGIEVSVVYFIASDCPQAALIRRVSITNVSDQPRQIEAVDGMPQVIPCGISNSQFKTEGNTFCAWADTLRLPTGEAFFGVHQSLIDGAEVTKPEDGYFCAAYVDMESCPLIVDRAIIFEADVSLQKPLGFIRHGMGILQETQYTVNRVPCAFAIANKQLAAGQYVCIDSIFGYADNKKFIHTAAKTLALSFDHMQLKTNELITNILNDVKTRTSKPELDAYISQSYLDNVLRGGMPITFDHCQGRLVHYIFGRKHGDLERDYNEFQLNATYYSQGNGNYRDLCQNRRNDVFFTPEAGLLNIKTFMELIQIDGYNPLSINGYTYRVLSEHIGQLTKYLKDDCMPDTLIKALQNGFDVGWLLRFAEEIRQNLNIEPEDFVKHCMYFAEQRVESEYKAGYWSDHFSYNMDLIENYLAVFPDKLNQLLYEESFRFHHTDIRVRPQSLQFVVTANGVRRYNATVGLPEINADKDQFLKDRSGNVVSVSLYVKLLSLALIKFCCLDPGGMGIEMEAGKPGWNDSLNGLPGMLGSGIPETIELQRIINFLIAAPDSNIKVPCEIGHLITVVDETISQSADSIEQWQCLSSAREAFRGSCYEALSGDEQFIHTSSLKPCLSRMSKVLQAGIAKAQNQYGPLIPTYLSYEMQNYKEDGRIKPQAFEIQRLPDYLEASARLMRGLDREQAKKLHALVKSSALWDDKLKLFKVGDSIQSLTHEIGRARAFPRGWFENESVFLHMTYKYLLGLLESGLYDEFFSEIKTSFVPFFDVERYGRSILENCSFIASSVNPDPKTHGRGYIARLSGATAEVLSMWNIMMTGGTPFTIKNGELCFQLSPKLASWMFDEKGEVSFTMLGQTGFRIINSEQLNTFSKGVFIHSYEILWRDGQVSKSQKVKGQSALRIRNQEAKQVLVYIES